MEEKTTAKARLNDIMNRKVNMDFLKNINLPPIKIPKIKSRKIFNTKAPSKTDNIVPLPEPTCVDRSPSRISTISSLVHNDPDPDYNASFGHLSIAQSALDIRPDVEKERKTNRRKDDPSNKPQTFSEKLSKQYKDFSEFKFRHILGKKTIVRQTTIDVNNYSHQPDELTSERSDYDFEFHSLPPSKFGRGEEFTVDDDNESAKGWHGKPSSRQESIESDEVHSISRKVESIQKEPNNEPNKSSLFKQMKSMSIKRMTGSASKQTNDQIYEDKHMDNDLKNSKKGNSSKMSFNRQTIEDACSKAKSSVSQQIQKLKSIQTRRQHGEPTTPGEGKYTKNPNTEVIFPNITYNTETDGVVRSLSPPEASSRPSSRCYTDRSRRQDSIGGFPRRFLRQQSSSENSEEPSPPPKYAPPIRAFEDIEDEPRTGFVGVSHLGDKFQSGRRTRPIQVPIPMPPLDIPQNSWKSFKVVGKLPRQQSSGSSRNSSLKISRPAPPLPPGKPTVHSAIESITKTEMIRRRFCQKWDDSLDTNMNASRDSQDSDSWIPNMFNGPSRNQISLKSTEESGNAWSKTIQQKKPVLQKSLSVDIFDPEVEEPFNDFDEALQNVPTVKVDTATIVVPVPAPSSIPTTKLPAADAVKSSTQTQEVKQITIAKGEIERANGNHGTKNTKFSKILSRFENNTIENSRNNNHSFMEELASTYEITNVIQNAEFIKPTISVTQQSPKFKNCPRNPSHRSFPLPPPPPPPGSHKPQAPEKKEKINQNTSQNKLSDLSNEIKAAQEFQQTIIAEVSKLEIQESKATTKDERPFLKKFLKNEVTHSTLCDELDEDVFHSLDYEDAPPNDAKPLTHRKSMRVVYTAEV